jgi:hypothetical protein
MGFKNALERTQGDARCLGQHPPHPVGHLTRWSPKRQIIDGALYTISAASGFQSGNPMDMMRQG